MRMCVKYGDGLAASNPQESKYALSVSFLAIFMLIGQNPAQIKELVKNAFFSVLAGGRQSIKLFISDKNNHNFGMV